MTALSLLVKLDRFTFTHASESDLQTAIESALEEAGEDAEREVDVPGAGRIDFLTSARVGIEIKVRGAIAEVAEQLQRYAQSDLVDELLLITTRGQHRQLPATLGGKRLEVLVVRGGLQ